MQLEMGNILYNSVISLSCPKKSIFLVHLIIINLLCYNEAMSDSSRNDETCAKIRLSSGKVIKLIENEFVGKEKLELVNKEMLINAIFEVSTKGNCVVEICGYRWPPDDFYESGTCKWYSSGKTPALASLHDHKFEVSSMNCACKSFENYNRSCQINTCSLTNHTWLGYQCGVLFQEPDCQNCIFDRVQLKLGSEFKSLNTYQIKSVIVRPNCTVVKHTNGAIYVDTPYDFEYNSTRNISPVYHKDSENFTCVCDQSVITDMTADPLTIEDVNESTSENDNGNILMYILPSAGLITLVFGMGLVIREVLLRRKGLSKSRQVTEEKGEGEIKEESQESFEMTEINSVKESTTNIEREISEKTMEVLKRNVDQLFEPSQNLEESQVPSVTTLRNKILMNKDFDEMKEQFHAACEPQFIVNPNLLRIDEELGRGQFSVVFRGLLTYMDGLQENVAIKQLKWIEIKEKVFNAFLREVKIYQFVGINHENIVRFLGACCWEGELYIITKLCELGDLGSYLRGPMKEKLFPEDEKETCGYLIVKSCGSNTGSDLLSQDRELYQLLYWAEQIANGMIYLNEMKVIHLDLAVRNILLCGDLTAKIADLGLSRKCLDGKDYAQSLLMGLFPPNSFALECFTENPDVDKKLTIYVDIWAYGCTIWEIFSLGAVPYPNMNFLAVGKFLESGQRLMKPELAPDYLYDKLLNCWDKEPEKRPNFLELKKFFEQKKKEIAMEVV